MSSSRLVGIDVARIVAALGVMLFHYGFWWWAADASTMRRILEGALPYRGLAPLALWGRVGVEIFFVVSGFVIAYSAARSGTMKFTAARLLRLLPAILICATITLCVSLWIGLRPPLDLLAAYAASVTLWPYGPWIDGVYWTLGIEVTFYALVALMLAFGLMKRIELVVAGLGCISAGYWLWWLLGFVRLVGGPPPLLDPRTNQLLIEYWVFFAVGVTLWAAANKGWTAARSLVLGFLISGGVACIYVTTPISGVLSEMYRFVPVGVWLGGVALIALASPLDAMLPDWLRRPIAVCGLATFPLYLLHQICGAVLLKALLNAGLQRHIALIATMGSMVVAALLISAFIEPNLRKVLRSALQVLTPRGLAAR